MIHERKGEVCYQIATAWGFGWVLKRRYMKLQDVPERWGWHTVQWCGVTKTAGWRGSDNTYPHIPEVAEFFPSDEVTFNTWWERCAT